MRKKWLLLQYPQFLLCGCYLIHMVGPNMVHFFCTFMWAQKITTMHLFSNFLQTRGLSSQNNFLSPAPAFCKIGCCQKKKLTNGDTWGLFLYSLPNKISIYCRKKNDIIILLIPPKTLNVFCNMMTVSVYAIWGGPGVTMCWGSGFIAHGMQHWH